MHRINQLYRNVLITPDEVIFHAQTKQTLDPRMILNAIIIAEERLIRPALGYDLYTALIDSKNKLVTAGNKATLQAEIQASLPENSQGTTLSEGDIVNAMEYLSAENLTLWKQHLWKLTAECVMLAAMPESYVQYASEGVIHTAPTSSPLSSPGSAVTPELRSVKWVMDKKMMDRIDPLREAMHQWLCKQKKADETKYALYTKACDCDVDGVAYKRKSDIVLGVYDDADIDDAWWRYPNCCP